MNKTPRSNRFHIGLYGATNMGKSSLINKLFKREISIVSSQSGTTTDPVYKNIEIDQLGPLTLIDTAGLDDQGQLGGLRVDKTLETLNEIDLALYLVDKDLDLGHFWEIEASLKKNKTPYLILVNKLDQISQEEEASLRARLRDLKLKAIFISAETGQGLEDLLSYLRETIEFKNDNIFSGLAQGRKHILLVISIDSEYPQGRLILPQSQAIRDALGLDNFVSIVKDSELEDFLGLGIKIDLVVVDSKIFGQVKNQVGDLPLTSFSILMANHKGDIRAFLDGMEAMEKLRDQEDVKILIYESCNHTANHEDIGRVKIPRLLNKFFSQEPRIDFAYSKDFSKFKDYDLIIHCGACMEGKTAMLNKISQCQAEGIPIVNYGILLAYFAGILDRSTEIFK